MKTSPPSVGRLSRQCMITNTQVSIACYGESLTLYFLTNYIEGSVGLRSGQDVTVERKIACLESNSGREARSP
jgi:hypothetical protein